VKTEILSSKVRNETKVSILPTLIQYSTENPIQSNKARERNKRNSNREGRSQIFLFADDMILYFKGSKDSTKILLDLRDFQKCNRI
jgi:hypothetical protein